MGDTDVLLLMVLVLALVAACTDGGRRGAARPKRVTPPVVTDAEKIARGKPLRRPAQAPFSPAPSQRTRRWWLR